MSKEEQGRMFFFELWFKFFLAVFQFQCRSKFRHVLFDYPLKEKKISPNVQLFVEEKCEDIYSTGYICKLFIFRLIDFT